MSDQLVVRLGGRAFGLDVLGGELAYISHAHSDHSSAVGGPLPIFCSDPTADMLGLPGLGGKTEDAGEDAPPARIEASRAQIEAPPTLIDPPSKPKTRRARRKDPQACHRIPTPSGIELHPAGHILGSTQLLGTSEALGRVVYTGDFKMRDGLTLKGASVVPCDTLIAECTYGDPGLSFPHPADVWSDMERWGRQNRGSIQLWGGYSTGKAQELVKFLNDYLDVTPVVSPRIAQVCAYYVKHGVPLSWLDSTAPEAQETMRDAFSCVLAPHHITPELARRLASVHRRKTLTVAATGWCLVRQLPFSAAFPLSDHADFNELLEYSHACGAKRIYLAHGDNERTAKALRASGLDAQAIDHIGEGRQMVLEVAREAQG